LRETHGFTELGRAIGSMQQVRQTSSRRVDGPNGKAHLKLIEQAAMWNSIRHNIELVAKSGTIDVSL
jgi:hypothetical protein